MEYVKWKSEYIYERCWGRIFSKGRTPTSGIGHCLEYTSKNVLFLFGHETNLQNILKIVYNMNVDAFGKAYDKKAFCMGVVLSP